jgi:alpha-beta hydrolase superfamily lysophospholipase
MSATPVVRPAPGSPATAADEYPAFVPAPGGDLLAVVTEPTVQPAGLAAVLLRGAGWRPSSGPRRTQVTTSRRLAARGFHAVRFSYHGLAESGGAGEEVVRLDRPYTADAGAVVDWVAARGLRAVLVGNCFGARTALAYAAGPDAGDKVAGLALVVPPVYDFEVARRLDRRPLAHFAKRARIGRLWAVLRDPARRGALRRTLRALAGVAGAKLRRRHRDRPAPGAPTRPSTGAPPAGAPDWLSRRFVAQLRTAVARGVPVLFVYGEDDPYGADFALARATLLGPVLAQAGDLVTVTRVPGRVHGLTSVETQQAMIAAVDAWAGSTFGPQA